MDPDEIDDMEVIDPLLMQDQNPEEILDPNPEEILDLEEEEDSTISTINDHDCEGDKDLGANSEDIKKDRITGVSHGNRTRTRNCKYFNNDAINIMTAKDEQPESHSGKHRDSNPTCEDDVVMGVFECILARFNLEQGLKLYGERGKGTTKKELLQIHNMDAIIPLDAETFLKDGKKRAMASLIFLTEERDGTVKARQCANGRKQ